MTFTDAAVEVLRLVGRPLHYKEITDFAIDKNLLSHVGKSPEVTMGARLAALMKKDAPDCPLVRVKPGVFALRDWDDKTLKSGMDGRRKKGSRGAAAVTEAVSATEEVVVDADEQDEIEVESEPLLGAASDDDSEPVEVAANDAEEDDDEVLILRPEPSAPGSPPASPPARQRTPVVPVDDGDEPRAPEERMRAELVAGAAEIFDEEDDDDQPILGGPDDKAGEGQDGRRRRRRRRRGRGPAGAEGSLPSYTATPVDGAREHAPRQERGESQARGEGRGEHRERGEHRDRAEPRDRGEQRTQILDVFGEGSPNLDDLAGRDLADAVAHVLTSFDRNMGPVSLRQVADSAQRRGKLAGDSQLAQSLVAAAVRADNSRRAASGVRPRFRFAGGRVGLTDWVLSSDLVQAEAEAIAAVERYREASRRALAKKVSELPGHAFVELCALVLERAGVTQLRAIRRAGVPSYEAHFCANMRVVGDDLKVALVIRRDGREIGRERVTELRGALHHYGPATLGWILTSGQVLSGARDEAASPGTSPISLTDGYGLARLCEDNDVAVLRSRLPIALPDIDLLEALRAS